MKPAGIIGIILIVIGIIAMAYGGFSFKEHKKDVDIGTVQIGHTEEHSVPLSKVLPVRMSRTALGTSAVRSMYVGTLPGPTPNAGFPAL